MEESQTEKHRRILGILFIVASALTLIGAMVVFVGMGVVGQNMPNRHDEEAARQFFLLTMGITGFLFLLSLPCLITGIGLLKRQRWAKTWALVVGILSLPSFPLGTVLGIYAIWFYTQPGANQVFE